MNALARAWDRVWFRPFDPTSVGAFRLCLGVTLFLYYLALLPNYERYFAADGVLSLAPPGPERPPRPHLSVFTWTEGVVPVRAFAVVGLLASAVLAVGWRSRLWALTLLVLVTSQMLTNNLLNRGEDVVFRMMLFLGLFAPLDHSLSLAARKGGAPEEAPTIWAVRLMQVSLALVYVLSLPRKLVGNADWLDGTAMYWILVNDTISRWPWPEAFHGLKGEILSAVLTFGTILVQMAFPLLVWFRRTRAPVLLAAALMHLGIGVAIKNLGFFSAAMLCCFWLFVPGETTRRWLTRDPSRARSGAG